VERPDPGAGRRLNLLKKRHYILFVSTDDKGAVTKVPVPMHYAYIFVAAAVIGLFTVTGLAGSYSRMLVKMSYFNQVRKDRDLARADNAHLTEALHQKEVQTASLGSLATEVSALYGFTASKLSQVHIGGRASKSSGNAAANLVATAPLAVATSDSSLTDESYFKSLDTFYALRTSAMSGSVTRELTGSTFGHVSLLGDPDSGIVGDSFDSPGGIPSLWPVMGPISSSFGQREDPVLGNGDGEFHKGLDISAPSGTPVRATADGTIKLAGMVNGYGREVVIDHGHGLETGYGHLSAFAVMPGETVVRGQVIGYVGHSGRVTGNNLHYEVRIRNTPVNPHKYLRETMAEVGSLPPAGN
jgi:murein DD-endopeptidase MepM/ murein hydrolase activator NlpD